MIISKNKWNNINHIINIQNSQQAIILLGDKKKHRIILIKIKKLSSLFLLTLTESTSHHYTLFT